MICEARLEGIVVKKNQNNSRAGAPIITLTIKNIRKYLNYKGEPSETTSWHTVHCIDSIRFIADDIDISDFILVEGHISNRRREDGPSAGTFVYTILATKITVLINFFHGLKLQS